MEHILNAYYENNAKKLRQVVDGILLRFAGLSDKDYDDFYSLANEVFVDVMKRYDSSRSFSGFLYSCLSNRIKTEMTKKNRYKRMVDRMSVSIDEFIDDEDDTTIGDMIASDFDLEKEVGFGEEQVEKYLASLSKIQRKIVEMKMEDIPVSEIKEKLGLTAKQYENHCKELRAFENINMLFYDVSVYKLESKEDKIMQQTSTQTMEKSKSDKLSIASVIKKMDKQVIRFDHPLQRESQQWSSPSMRGNLISDILQGNPIPSLVFAEQLVNGVAIIWNLDGKQRCTNAYSFRKNGYKISKNIRRYMIEYQASVGDENNLLMYEKRFFDIRGKKFSDLPEELQDRFDDYNFEIVQYLNCSNEDIAYHIARYNEGKPMTVSQKGMTRLGEEYAGKVKDISNMSFFKDIGGYKVSEYKNGTINRVVVEGIMAANYLEDWKKKQEEMCEYIKERASVKDFENFKDMVKRLEKVVTPNVSGMFNSKDSFLWFGLFARFIKFEINDRKFVEFLAEFARTLHSKVIDGVSFDELNSKATKDKNAVLARMRYLEKVLSEYLGM